MTTATPARTTLRRLRNFVDGDYVEPSEMPHGGFKHSGHGKDLSAYAGGGVHARQARHGRVGT